MKKTCKFLIYIIITQVLIVCLSGCDLKSNEKVKESNSTKENGDVVYTKDFGSYTVSSGWEESKTHSSKSKFFYVKNGEDKEKRIAKFSRTFDELSNKSQKEVLEFIDFKRNLENK